MSVGEVVKETLVQAAVAAARAVLADLADEDKIAALDETAERLKFDAEGERQLAARKARR